MVELAMCDNIYFFNHWRCPAGTRRPTRVKAVRPLAPSSRTGSSEIPARTGPSQKPAGCPRAGRIIETPQTHSPRARAITQRCGAEVPFGYPVFQYFQRKHILSRPNSPVAPRPSDLLAEVREVLERSIGT